MMTDVSLLLHTMIQLSPQLFLNGVATERHLNSLFNFIALTNESSTDHDGNYIMLNVYLCCCGVLVILWHFRFKINFVYN